MQQRDPATRPQHPAIVHLRRKCGGGLLALAGLGAAWTAHATALSEIRLWYAVLLVQALALAAVAGVALLSIPSPGLARRARPGA